MKLFGLEINATHFNNSFVQQHYNNKYNVFDVSTISALLYKFTSLDVLQEQCLALSAMANTAW
jgi:hypothetical protein